MLKYLPFLVLLSVSVVYSRSASGSVYQTLASSDKRGVKQVHLPTINPPKESSIWNDLSFLYKIYQQCAKDNLTVCLKVKLLAGLEKAFKNSRELKIYQGVKFVKIEDNEEDNEINSAVMSEKEIQSQLPRAIEARDSTLNQMILAKVLSFLQSFTLQVKFPDDKDIQKSMEVEGRNHKKKSKHSKGAMIMIPLLLGGTFIPIAYGALAMLAGKALIVSKLALVLASIVGIKKLLSSGGHKESQHEVVVSGGHGSGWGRDFDLAFNSYAPKNEDQKLM